jgi:hypothetical protein
VLRVLAFACFSVYFGACGPNRAKQQAQRPRATAAPLRRVPIGLCEDYPEESRSLDEVRRDFELLKTAGIGVLRVSMGWDELEPQKDRYDFSFWDSFVDIAVREYHLKLIPYVAYTPEWNSNGAPRDFWKTPPRDVNEFAELLGLLARRYHGRIASWELWNEPDNRDYWLGSAADYARLLEAGANAVHAADPDAQVVFGGLAGGVEFLRTTFDQHGVSDRVDVVNLHSYYETWNPDPLETIPAYIDEVKSVVMRHGGRQAIWMAEVGYSDFRVAGNDGRVPFSYEHSLDFQAVMLARTFALALSEPAISLLAWYELKDARASDAVIGDAHNRHLGVTFADYRPKPALAALGFMSTLFSSGFRSLDSESVVERAPSSHCEVRSFLTARGNVVVMAWLRTQPDGASTTHGEADAREERVRVSLPYGARGQARRFDAQGRSQGQLPITTHAEGFELSLDLRGGEVQIVEIPLREGAGQSQ